MTARLIKTAPTISQANGDSGVYDNLGAGVLGIRVSAPTSGEMGSCGEWHGHGSIRWPRDRVIIIEAPSGV